MKEAEVSTDLESPVRLAVVGGGQLARMMQESAIALGVELRPLVEATDGSVGKVIPGSIVGVPADLEAMGQLIDGCDALTFEHEHIPAATLEALADKIAIHPSADALLYAQNKLEMRRRLSATGFPCPQWAEVTCLADVEDFGSRVGWPIVMKTAVGGYDGRGVRIVHSVDEASDWVGGSIPVIVEEKVPFVSEVAALVARRPSGESRAWPLVETEQINGVCAIVTAPAQGGLAQLEEWAQDLAVRIAEELDVTGVLAVEFFVVEQEGELRLLINELAMRPHNSGHWTIDGAVTSQFEQHIRAVLDLPLGQTSIRGSKTTVMVNLLGSTYPVVERRLSAAMAVDPSVRIHLYGKEVRPGRKLGHVCVSADETRQARNLAIDAVVELSGDIELRKWKH